MADVGLLVLPLDLKLAIWRFCSGNDVLKTAQVCKTLQRFVTENRRHLPLIGANLEVAFDSALDSWSLELTFASAKRPVGGHVQAMLPSTDRMKPFEQLAVRNSLNMVIQHRLLPYYPVVRATRLVEGIKSYNLMQLTREMRFVRLKSLGINFASDSLVPIPILLLLTEHFRDLHYSPVEFSLVGGNFAQISLNDWMVFLCALAGQGQGIRRVVLRGAQFMSYDYLLPAFNATGCLSHHSLVHYTETWPKDFATDDHHRQNLIPFLLGHVLAYYGPTNDGIAMGVRELYLGHPCELDAAVWVEIIKQWLAMPPVPCAQRAAVRLHISIDSVGKYEYFFKLFKSIISQLAPDSDYDDSLMLLNNGPVKSRLVYCDFEQEKFHFKLFVLPAREKYAENSIELTKAFRDVKWWSIRMLREADRAEAVRERLVKLRLLA